MMTLTHDDALRADVSAIRANMIDNPDNHFWDRNTMRFFGDKVSSFTCMTLLNVRYMYRKPSAWVSVFGERKKADKAHFNVWEVVVTSDGLHYDLLPVSKVTQDHIYERVRECAGKEHEGAATN